MKALMVLAIVAIVVGLYVQTQPRPPAATATAGAGSAPILHLTGTVSKHVEGGLIVSCTAWKPDLNKGHRREELVGVFFVVGLPMERSVPDGCAVEFEARAEGVYQYRTVLGVRNSVSRIRYVGTG
jgi:hypothetical protein